MPRLYRESVSIDVALARREFLLALARNAPNALAALFRCDSRANDSGAIVTEWAREWNLGPLWMREWARQAVNVISIERNAYVRSTVKAFGAIALLGQYSSPPAMISDHEELFELVTRWRFDEFPPDGGLGESKKEFLARMDRAFDARRDALRKSDCLPVAKPALRQHAEWMVRYHVGGESIAAIAADRTPNRTVEKALKQFALLVGLTFPRRSRPRLLKRT